MLGQHRADASGFRKAGMGPQHGCARPLPENALYRIGIGMRVPEDFVFFRELHDLAEYLAIGILAEDMKFADPSLILVTSEDSNLIPVGSPYNTTSS